MMHIARELCGGQICVTPDKAAFDSPETKPWLDKFYSVNENWVAEDRRKLLAFARDLLNSDYAGHRLTFQLFAQAPPFAHLNAVYRNFDWDGRCSSCKNRRSVERVMQKGARPAGDGAVAQWFAEHPSSGASSDAGAAPVPRPRTPPKRRHDHDERCAGEHDPGSGRAAPEIPAWHEPCGLHRQRGDHRRRRGTSRRHGVRHGFGIGRHPRPTLLVCIHHLSPVADALLANGVFCVNVLREDQAHVSDSFAGRSGAQGAEKFECATWTTEFTGAPRLIDSLVAFDCRVTASERVGSHFVVFGSVQDIAWRPAARR